MGISPETLFERSLAKMVAAPVALSLLIILAQWQNGLIIILARFPTSFHREFCRFLRFPHRNGMWRWTCSLDDAHSSPGRWSLPTATSTSSGAFI